MPQRSTRVLGNGLLVLALLILCPSRLPAADDMGSNFGRTSTRSVTAAKMVRI